jgi:hypothetical protein
MMRLPPGRNQRLDVRCRARHHIRLAEIALVGQQRFGPAKLFQQSIDLLQHRRDLLLVVGRLNHPGRSTDLADLRRAPECSANWGASDMPIVSAAQPPF